MGRWSCIYKDIYDFRIFLLLLYFVNDSIIFGFMYGIFLPFTVEESEYNLTLISSEER